MPADSARPQKRKSRGSLTDNACLECKQKKTKCDGKSPCSRCNDRGNTACEYSISGRARKGQMKDEIHRLQTDLSHCQHILKALCLGVHSDFIMQQLRNDSTFENVYSWLLANEEASSEEFDTNNQGGMGFSYNESEIMSSSNPNGDSTTFQQGSSGYSSYPFAAYPLTGEEMGNQIIYSQGAWTPARDLKLS